MRLVFVALLWGLWQTIALIVLWWYAALHDWEVRIPFNNYNEGVFEGVLMHIGLVVTMVATLLVVRWLPRHR